MANEIKEEIVILLNEARNKINKAIILYSKFEQDDVYLKTAKEVLTEEIKDLTKKGK